MSNIRIIAEKESEKIDKDLSALRKVISGSPSGKLKCNKWGDARKSYYVVRNVSGKVKAEYIPVKERELARDLAFRDFCIKKVKILKTNQKVLTSLIEKYEPFPNEVVSGSMNPDHYLLIKDTVPNTKEAVMEWKTAGYEKNMNRTDASVQRTLCGIMVRSKSEAIIADQLYNHGIPFRYESLIDINEKAYYPDFTILHPRTLKQIVWEHFGMMSNPSYRYNAFKKLSVYSDGGLKLDTDLIVTFEWNDSPLDPLYVSAIIEHFFE